jgi:hypothetical protein
MPRIKQRDVRVQRADHRRRTHTPSVPIEELEQELMRQLTPTTFAQARAGHTHVNLRDRVLNLPTMCAIVLSLVCRQIASLGEVLRVLEREGLLWAEALKVSKEALSKRFEKLPASLFASVFEQVVNAQQARRAAGGSRDGNSPHAEQTTDAVAALSKQYACVWIGDCSTLEQLRKTTAELRQKSDSVLGGKILMLVDASDHQPMAVFYEEYGRINEKCFNHRMIEAMPVGGLVVLDAGFFSFEFFDTMTDAGKYFITRMRNRIAYRTVEVLSKGARYCDVIIEMGLHRSDPCRHRVRMVSILWGTTWYRYLTNELDGGRMSAEQVTTLYRTRWRIEEAFLLTKRLLGLAYLWVGGTNGIQIQIYATLIFYTVLTGLCCDVAKELKQPLDRISVEMVFRGLYHYSRAIKRDPTTELVPYLCAQSKSLAIVKAERKRERQRDAQLAEIWGAA